MRADQERPLTEALPAAARAADPENLPLTAVRGLASLWVFVCHVAIAFYGQLSPGVASSLSCGWLGVDVFFVLSGFILASVYGAVTPGGAWRFWARRLFRVLPLNLVIVGGLALLAAAGLNTGAYVDWPHLPWHLLMLQSFVPGHQPGWIVVNWSVGVELICYLLFPALSVALGRLGLRGAWVGVAAAGALTWWAETRAAGALFGWQAVLRCVPEFCLGAACATAARHAPAILRHRAAATAAECAGVVGLGWAAAAGAGAMWCLAPGSGRVAVAPIAASVLIGALSSGAGLLARALSAPLPVWLGRVSFSLYLVHHPLMIRLAPVAWRAAGGPPPAWMVALWGALVLAIALALSATLLALVEQPGRRLGARLLRRGPVARG